MEYNVAEMSATASLGDTYSGDPIFDDFLAIWLNLLDGVCYVDFESINCLWFIHIDLRFKIASEEEV